MSWITGVTSKYLATWRNVLKDMAKFWNTPPSLIFESPNVLIYAPLFKAFRQVAGYFEVALMRLITDRSPSFHIHLMLKFSCKHRCKHSRNPASRGAILDHA